MTMTSRELLKKAGIPDKALDELTDAQCDEMSLSVYDAIKDHTPKIKGLERIKVRFNQFYFVHSYIDDNSCKQEWNDAHEAIGYLLQRIERYEKGLQHIADRDNCYDDLPKVAEEALKE